MSDQSNTQSKVPPAPPRRTPPGHVAPLEVQQNSQQLSSDEREKQQQKIIQSAPLRSTDATDIGKQPAEAKSEVHVKPWREGMNLSSEQLMQIRNKTSINQPQELMLRLGYLTAERNKVRGFGPKVHVSDLINEAVEQYTRAELKKLGLDTKD